ncbi:hypothetical protein CROQUDRAFT_269690 [Cronartium quercuum f. sp. fusiforme G11]|uniref:Protein UNC80 C-terminal domain-containing protein n=1 Tax=Cronartium quercuum f. sp. fusiforme G11 TaxID=708437 RepID=A0A9P6T7P7_9BASI|nr:hypothetical protein CROQUDRAFT_269690 [Cronartium quercuum f. sp. fusiforme G11]
MCPLKALEELGWDDDQKARQMAFERQRAPLTVLPLAQPHAGGGDGELPSRSNTPTPSLRRRSSAASMHEAFSKKQQRSVVTPATARLLMMASLLSHDKNTRVCVIARKLIMDLIRDESNAVLRPFTEDLSGSSAEVGRALKMVRSMLEINYCYPPVFAHQLFSHLVGWSKSIARLSYRSDVFANMASALSIASAASIHVQQFNMRDIKRAKIEHMLLSHGQLWFVEPGRDRLLPTSSTANASSQLQNLSIPRVLFDVTRTRIAQIRLMASYLRQQPKEAFNLRQHLHGCLLILPVDEGLPSPLENRFFLPRTDRQAIISAASDPDNYGLHSLSRVLALSWLDLLSQLFNGLTTLTVAQQEFVELFDSINRILICHSYDVLTVSNCLKVCMQASTKFRRLFRVKGFAMFVPLVFKVYCEAKTCNFQVIMEAIAFAWKRWFICHGDAFIFQALAACAPVMTRPGVDEHAQKAMASSLFDLLTSLTANHTTAKRDIAALDGVNTAEEQAALSYLAKHRPELFVSNREGSSDGSHDHLAPLDENQTFELGDLCKLFFTAIAFDPTSDRSGSFIRLLSLLIPHLTRLPASSKILHEGVDALLKVYAKPLPKSGLGETSTNTDAVPVGQKVAYMGVVTAFVEAGGKLTDTAISRLIQLAFQIIRADSAAGQLTSMRFLCVYVQTHTHARGQSNAVKQPVMFLRETLTIFKDTLEEIDYSSFLECLQEFMESADLKSTELNGLALLYVRYALGAHAIQYDLKVFSRDLRRSCARLSATIAKKSMLPSLTSLHIDPSKPHALVDFLIPLALALPSDPTQATVSLESSWIMLIATAVKFLSADHFKTTRGLVCELDRTLSFLLSIQLLKIALTKGFQALRANDVVWTHVADHLKSVLSSSAVSFISSLESQAWVIGAQEEQCGLPVIEYAT